MGEQRCDKLIASGSKDVWRLDQVELTQTKKKSDDQRFLLKNTTVMLPNFYHSWRTWDPFTNFAHRKYNFGHKW